MARNGEAQDKEWISDFQLTCGHASDVGWIAAI
jgi:hypothetical protein